MWISVTRLHLRSTRQFLPFLCHTLGSLWQFKSAPGRLRLRITREDALTYWTLTAWQSEAAMRAYRDQGRHRQAMRAGPQLADVLESASWEADAFPDWGEAQVRLHAKYGRG